MQNEPLRPAPKPGTDKQRQGRTNKRRGTAAENAVAKKLGGRRVYKSGASPFEKGDVKVDDADLFIEVKHVSTATGLRREWLEKTILDAGVAGQLPVVAVRFPGGGGYYATTAEVFEELVSQVRQLRAQVREYEAGVLGDGDTRAAG